MNCLSPFGRRRQQKLAAALNAQEGEISSGARTEYELQLFQLRMHEKQLRDIQSMQAKSKRKAEILPDYDPWLDGVLQSEHPNRADQVFSTCLLWHIDAGNLDRAAKLAIFAVSHNFETLDNFERTLPCIVVEEFAAALGRGASIELENFFDLDKCVSAKGIDGLYLYDMPDKVRAKWLKAGAIYLEKIDGHKEVAFVAFKEALRLWPEVGVKKDITRLTKELSS